MNTKNALINEVASMLSTDFSADQSRKVVQKLTIALEKYDVSTKCTEIAVVDTESEMLLKKFLATKHVEGRSAKTIQRYQYILTRYYQASNIPFVETDVYALRLYLAQLETQGCNDNTINGIRSIFCSFFGWLFNEGFIDKNPTANLGAVKCKKVVRKPFSNTELELIKNNCETLRDRAIVEFLLSTGCRISEVTALNVSDINFATQECTVLGKGNRERVVFLNDVCVLHLKRYLNSRDTDNDILFVGKGNIRLENGGVRAMLKRIEETSGVENIHPHRFRRTLATSLIDRGMVIQDVAAILGHANINTTMTYIYTKKENVRSSFRKLAS